MAGLDREVLTILSFLASKGCHVNQTWLSDCINFFRSENHQYNMKTLEDFVYDQWLLADLRDMDGVGSFPPDVTSHISIVLKGRMACQIECVSDIGHAAYSQMQKLRNEDIGNLEIKDEIKDYQQAWEPKSNRMLNLSLCDGIQSLKAIEYRPISFLKTDLVPGTKALIVGPVFCRRGVLLLEEKNLKILGGEVDALVIQNAFENVLAGKLNLPQNPDPYKTRNVAQQVPLSSEIVSVTETVPPRTNHTPAPNTSTLNLPAQFPVISTNRSKKLIQSSLSWERTNVKSSWSKQPIRPETKVKSVHLTDNNLDADLKMEDWESDWDFDGNPSNNHAVEHHQSQSDIQHDTKELSKPQSNEFEMGSDDEDVLLKAEAMASMSSAPSKSFLNSEKSFTLIGSLASRSVSGNPQNINQRKCPTMKRQAPEEPSDSPLRRPLFNKQQKRETSSQEVSSSSDLNFDLWSEDWSNMDGTFLQPQHDLGESDEINLPIEIPASPFVYISQIFNKKHVCPRVFRVKAAILTVVDKLKIVNAEWQLSAKICDGSGPNMLVKLSSKVLENLIGLSAINMQQMKKDPSKIEMIKKKLERAQKQIINLNCFLDIEISSTHDETPTVVLLEELSMEAVSALRNRQL